MQKIATAMKKEKQRPPLTEEERNAGERIGDFSGMHVLERWQKKDQKK